ncbi:EVE domain-containing protein [uncultured Enterococcus sp.]|uniref:EVE domain-containing protein n=1 Tax=uncultured Enterococcus sp. TaxID=167972 RepID=UPI002AA65883|nr:EVE domain-containing protein [uncultured Enterococcus sp.]
MKFWIGVASKEHVEIGVEGGFAQLCHGKCAPLNRMKAGDWLIYYAPKVSMQTNQPYQKFMAVGQVLEGEAYLFEMYPGFISYRKNVSFQKVTSPLSLEGISKFPIWQDYRSKLRFGHFEISEELFELIAFSMVEG